MATAETRSAPAKNPENWGNIRDVLDGPLDRVDWDASWLSVIGLWLFLIPTIIQGILARTFMKLYVCMSVGTCLIPGSQKFCSVMGSVLSGHPWYSAWVSWRGVLSMLITLGTERRSRLGLYFWEQRAFGGKYWWQGDALWVGSYKECDQILRGPQARTKAVGAAAACTPDLFPLKLLIFLPNGEEGSEWASIRGVMHKFFLQQGSEMYMSRQSRLPEMLASDWKDPKLTDLSSKKFCQRQVSKCIFFLMFGVWVTEEEAAILALWRGYAPLFILPRLIQRFIFNIGINKVKKLREQTVGMVEKYGKQDVFCRLNDSLGRWKREKVVQLVDEIMFAVGFAGVGGTSAATESAGMFLQARYPDESPGKDYIHFGELDTSEKMIAKYKENPARYIKEVCRLDPPVTDATTTLPEDTKITLAGREYNLPKGLLKQYVGACANRDQSVFPNDKLFDPDRTNLEKALTWNGAFGAADEGSYPRICPGRHLSIQISTAICNHALGLGTLEVTV